MRWYNRLLLLLIMLLCVLALYAFKFLPVGYAGFSLMILGVTCVVAEIAMLAFGILGVGGVIAFVAGAIMLLKTNMAVIVVMVLFFTLVLTRMIRSRRRPVVSERAALVGQIGVVELDRGQVWIRVATERWQAIGDQHLQPGQKVQVLDVKGLKLLVKPYVELRGDFTEPFTM